MTALAYLIVAVIIYFLGVSRGHMLADRDAGRGGTGPVRFDAWDEEDGPSTGSLYRAGYRAGWDDRDSRSPGIRDRLLAGAEGGREVEQGKVLGG